MPRLPVDLFNPVDRVVAWFSPRAGLQRLGARAVLAKAHEAASPSRSRKFHRDTAGPNQIVSQGAVPLRAQARHMERNNDIARGILRTMVNNIVGPNGIGIEPQPRRPDGSIHEAYAAELREAWRDWCITPEVTHTFHFAAVQRMLVKTMLRDGEAFGQHLAGPVPYLDHGTRVPYSLELFEPDMVPLEYQNKDNTFQGIERNAWGRAVAYFVYKGNPLDNTNISAIAGLNAGALKRIPAERIMHLALRDRIGQMRGVSEFASIIGRLEDIKDYEESERVAAKVAAALTAYIKKTSPEGYDGSLALTDDAGNPIGRDLRMNPGTIIDGLAVGEEIGIIDSKRPNPNVITFRQGQLRAVAAGIGASYSSIARDYNGTYSAQRQELVEQWINYATLTDEFVGLCLQPIWAQFVAAASISGIVKPPKDLRPGSETDALYIAQAMPWIDPMKEAEAYTALVKAGFASEVEVMRKRGVNPRDLLEQVAQWRKETAERGLVFSSDAANDVPPAAAPAEAPAAEAAQAQARAQASVAQQTNQQLISAMAAGVAAIAQREPQGATIHVAASAPPAVSVPVTINPQAVHIAPAQVDVHNQVNPTPVTVQATVTPAAVVLNHPASSTAEHERDPGTQEIVRTVTTYTSAAAPSA